MPLLFRPSPDDFHVDEIPLPPPATEGGPHAHVEIEKRLLSSAEAIRRIALRLGRSEAAIGWAGAKDAHARTTQRISIEGLREDEIERIGDERIRVLSVARRPRKIALGELLGNRFFVRLRGAVPGDAGRLATRLARLAAEGVPNRFGAQRFGMRGMGAGIGKAILLERHRLALDLLLGAPRPVEGDRLRDARTRYERGDLAGALRTFPASFAPERAALTVLAGGGDPAAAVHAIPWKAREGYLHAYQSSLFNRLLAARVEAGTLAVVEPGDVVAPAEGEPERAPATSGPALEALRERAATFTLSAAGPLFGHAVLPAAGEPARREAALLLEEGISLSTWKGPPGLALRGARRPYRFRVEEASVTAEGADAISLRFRLPPGCYATTLVEELGAISGGPQTTL